MNTYLKYKPVWIKVFALGSLIFGSVLIFSLISYVLAAKLTGFTLQELLDPDFNNPKMAGLQRWLLPLNSSVSAFLIPSLLYAYFADPKPWRFLRADTKPSYSYWIVAVIIIIVAIPSAFWVAELNSHLDLSHIFPSFDRWIREAEKLANNTLEKIIGKQQISDLITNLFLFALVPAISEEFFFRGLILKGIIRYTRNVWLGILLSAFIFSAFHFQFLSFLARFEMGIILGALFWYSGSIWISILAHFLFNGFQLALEYWQPDLQTPPSWLVSAGVVGLSFLTVLVLTFILRKNSTVSMAEVYDDDDDFIIGLDNHG
jgi:membrane protease YdiL (CAAX protease family)